MKLIVPRSKRRKALRILRQNAAAAQAYRAANPSAGEDPACPSCAAPMRPLQVWHRRSFLATLLLIGAAAAWGMFQAGFFSLAMSIPMGLAMAWAVLYPAWTAFDGSGSAAQPYRCTACGRVSRPYQD